MEIITYGFFTATIGGLGLLIWYCPQYSRKFLPKFGLVIFIILILFSISYSSKIESYDKMKNKSIEILSTHNIQNSSEIISQIDSACKEMSTETGNNIKPYAQQVFGLLIAVVIFYLLSFWFEEIKKKITNKTPNSTV